MSNIIVSIGIKHGIVAIIVLEDGCLKLKNVQQIKDTEVADSNYLSMIYAFTLALRLVRKYISDNKSNRDICFEISNSIFIKWVDNQYSKEAYQDKFIECMKLLQELPIRYALSYNPKPRAIPYASESYIEKNKLTGLEIED